MPVDLEFSIWLASRTRWAHLTKTISMPVMPRVGEYVKFRNEQEGDYFPWRITEITHRESGPIEVWTELLDNVDNRMYSFEEEQEFDDCFQSYANEGWRCERGVRPNTQYQSRVQPPDDTV